MHSPNSIPIAVNFNKIMRTRSTCALAEVHMCVLCVRLVVVRINAWKHQWDISCNLCSASYLPYVLFTLSQDSVASYIQALHSNWPIICVLDILWPAYYNIITFSVRLISVECMTSTLDCCGIAAKCNYMIYDPENYSLILARARTQVNCMCQHGERWTIHANCLLIKFSASFFFHEEFSLLLWLFGAIWCRNIFVSCWDANIVNNSYDFCLYCLTETAIFLLNMLLHINIAFPFIE